MEAAQAEREGPRAPRVRAVLTRAVAAMAAVGASAEPLQVEGAMLTKSSTSTYVLH